jgi:hypothetical protein
MAELRFPIVANAFLKFWERLKVAEPDVELPAKIAFNFFSVGFASALNISEGTYNCPEDRAGVMKMIREEQDARSAAARKEAARDGLKTISTDEDDDGGVRN